MGRIEQDGNDGMPSYLPAHGAHVDKSEPPIYNITHHFPQFIQFTAAVITIDGRIRTRAGCRYIAVHLWDNHFREHFRWNLFTFGTLFYLWNWSWC
jgi:hypothetical protein